MLLVLYKYLKVFKLNIFYLLLILLIRSFLCMLCVLFSYNFRRFFFESLCYFAYPSVLVCAFLHLLCRCARMNFTEETCVPGFPYVFGKREKEFCGRNIRCSRVEIF